MWSWLKRWGSGIAALCAGKKSFDLIQIEIPFAWTGYRKRLDMPSTPNFFKAEEIVGLDKELVAKLDWARGRAQVAFMITRGKVTPEENEAVGGVKDSSHLTGHGVDLRCRNSRDRYRMLQALFLSGFKRIGVYVGDGHIHVDNDETLPPYVFWVKP